MLGFLCIEECGVQSNLLVVVAIAVAVILCAGSIIKISYYYCKVNMEPKGQAKKLKFLEALSREY